MALLEGIAVTGIIALIVSILSLLGLGLTWTGIFITFVVLQLIVVLIYARLGIEIYRRRNILRRVLSIEF